MFIILTLSLILLHLTKQTPVKEFYSAIQMTTSKNDFKTNFRANGLLQDREHRYLDQQAEGTMDESNYTTIISLVPFYGDWINDDTTVNVFEHLGQSEGFMKIESPTSDTTDPSIFSVEFLLYDGQYVDKKFIKISIYQPMSSLIFDSANASISGEQIQLSISSGYNKNSQMSQSCLSNFSVYFVDLETAKPFTTTINKHISDLGLEVTFQSAECMISIHSHIMKINDVSYQELLIYILTLALAAGAGMYSSNKLLYNFPENIMKLAKVSLWSIWLINAWDFYLFLYHIVLSVAVSGWLMIVALCFFSLSIMTETKLVYVIYLSSHRANGTPNLSSGCKFFGLYYGSLYLLVFSYTYLTNFIWIILTSCFYILPQIALVCARGKKYKFNFWHILGLSITKIAFVAYIKIYPTNIFRLSPDIKFASIYYSIICFQILILFFQRFFPRFCFTPRPFKYLIKITKTEEKEEMCPICMDLLKDQTNNAKPLLESEKTIIIMQTPCRHRFHEGCLSLWMKNKLECPSCRSAIPSLNNEDLD